MLPASPFQPNFVDNLYAQCCLRLFTDLNHYHNSPNIDTNFLEYKNAYKLYAIDLMPDLAANEGDENINKSSNLAIDIKFNSALTETVTLIAYAEFRKTIEIDKSRGVFTDF